MTELRGLQKARIVVQVLFIVSIGAPRVGDAAKLCRTYEHVVELTDPARSTATWRTLLGDTLVASDEGLIVAGVAVGHERETARRFGHYLHRKFGLTLVLMSKISGLTVPAFDGLIVNEDDVVVANISMKRTENKFNFRESHAKILDYNRIDTWAKNLLMHQAVTRQTLDFRSDDDLRAFDRRAALIRDLAKVFGIGTPRQTWMLMEFISARTVDPEQVASFARREASWNRYVSRILVIDDQTIYDVKPARTRPGELEGCERLLRTPVTSPAGL